jgi:hypothetical protein
MQTKFKRHDKVKILILPDEEYIEYHDESSDSQIQGDENPSKVQVGMYGRINILLPNGQYHVEILDSEGKTIAYAPMPEEALEKID